MAFDPNSQLDPGQVSDVRGSRFGGRGLAIGGGGGLGLILVIVYLLLGGNLSDLGGTSTAPGITEPGNSNLQQECSTGADANAKEDCRIVGYVNSVQKYWKDEFAKSGQSYKPAQTVLFSGQTDTACGTASTEVGPFYCPEDGHVYLDLGFFDELKTKFGATRGAPAHGHAVAREERAWGRAPRAGPGRTAVLGIGSAGRQRPVGADRTAGGLLRGRVGEPRRLDRFPRTPDPG